MTWKTLSFKNLCRAAAQNDYKHICKIRIVCGWSQNQVIIKTLHNTEVRSVRSSVFVLLTVKCKHQHHVYIWKWANMLILFIISHCGDTTFVKLQKNWQLFQRVPEPVQPLNHTHVSNHSYADDSQDFVTLTPNYNPFSAAARAAPGCIKHHSDEPTSRSLCFWNLENTERNWRAEFWKSSV